MGVLGINNPYSHLPGDSPNHADRIDCAYGADGCGQVAITKCRFSHCVGPGGFAHREVISQVEHLPTTSFFIYNHSGISSSPTKSTQAKSCEMTSLSMDLGEGRYSECRKRV